MASKTKASKIEVIDLANEPMVYVNTQDYRDAIDGTMPATLFSLAYDWMDKPHRLVYDLCNEIDRLRAKYEDPNGK